MIIELGLWKNEMRNYLREYVCIRGLEMLVFWKFLRMSLMDDPSFEYPVVNFVIE